MTNSSKYSKCLKNTGLERVQDFWATEALHFWKARAFPFWKAKASLAAQRKWKEVTTLTGPFGTWAKATQEEDRESWIQSPNSFHMGIQTPRNKAWQWMDLPFQEQPVASPGAHIHCRCLCHQGCPKKRINSLSPHNFHIADNLENNSRGNSKDLLKFQRGNLSEGAYVNRKNE